MDHQAIVDDIQAHVGHELDFARRERLPPIRAYSCTPRRGRRAGFDARRQQPSLRTRTMGDDDSPRAHRRE